MPADSLSLFQSPLLAQMPEITNWLTPVWIMSVGISIGFLLAVLGLFKILIVQKIGLFNSIDGNPTTRVVMGIALSVVYLALFLGLCYWRYGDTLFGENFILLLGFCIVTSAVLGFGAWSLVSKRMIGETWGLFTEGFLGWLNYFCIANVIFALLGLGLSQVNIGIRPVSEPIALMQSLARLPFTGTFEENFTIPANTDDEGYEIDVNFLGQELVQMEMESDRPVEMAVMPMTTDFNPQFLFEIRPLDTGENPDPYLQRPDGRGRIPFYTDTDTGEPLPVEHFYVNNPSTSEANLTLRWTLAPIYKEVSVIPLIAIGMMAIYVFYLIFAAMLPKTYAIALSTFKTEVSQPLYLLIMVIGVVFMVASIYIPYNTFGEDIKMYKDSGLTLMRVMAIFLAIWAASKSVAEEIEGRTALTVLSKPVGRRQFIFGKFTGISLAIGLLFIVLGFWFLTWVSYKPIYDYKEAAKGLAEWTVCFNETMHVLPGLVLYFLEVIVFVAVSVAISTRMGILPNFLICFSIYVLGHLTPLLVQSAIGEIETIQVFASLIAIVLPVLNHYDVHAAINTNADVPLVYMGWIVVYTGLYGAMAMLFALVLFEDRDLA